MSEGDRSGRVGAWRGLALGAQDRWGASPPFCVLSPLALVVGVAIAIKGDWLIALACFGLFVLFGLLHFGTNALSRHAARRGGLDESDPRGDAYRQAKERALR
jgi:hypothetical protein